MATNIAQQLLKDLIDRSGIDTEALAKFLEEDDADFGIQGSDEVPGNEAMEGQPQCEFLSGFSYLPSHPLWGCSKHTDPSPPLLVPHLIALIFAASHTSSTPTSTAAMLETCLLSVSFPLDAPSKEARVSSALFNLSPLALSQAKLLFA